jgi:hypothetical protein
VAEPDKEPKVDHDDRDVNTRPILRLAVILAVVIAAVMAGLAVFTPYLLRPDADRAPAPMSTELSRIPPDPRLQPDPRAQLRALRAYETTRLETYGWVDKNAKITHIPIERAMRLVADKGLPVRPAAEVVHPPKISVPTDSSLGATPAKEEHPAPPAKEEHPAPPAKEEHPAPPHKGEHP